MTLVERQKALDLIGKQYSTTVLKQAIAQSTLEKEQIKGMLTANGLQGELLETTADELANVVSTNAVAASQKAATTSTLGLGTAFKGLGMSIKAFATAHPILLAITVAIGAIAAGVKIIDACTTSFSELKDKISGYKQEVSDSQSNMDSLTTQLDEVNQKIKDIQSLGTLPLTEEKELKNLQTQKTELENMYNIEKARHDLALQDQEETIKEYLDKTFDSKYKKESYTQKQMKNGQFVDVSYSKAAKVTKTEEMEAATTEMLKQQKIIDNLNQQYHKLDNPTSEQTKEYQKNIAAAEKTRDEAKRTALDIQEECQEQVSGLDTTSESYQRVLSSSQKLSDGIAILNNDFESLSENGKKTQLKDHVVKNDNSKEINDYIDTLNSEELNVIANVTFDENTTVDSLKEAFEKAQAEADLLSTIKEELAENGRIGISSMQSIIRQYPEAKEA